MTGQAFRVEGLPELDRALDRLRHDAPDELREADEEVAGEIADQAQAAGFALGGVAAKAAPTVSASGGNVGFGGVEYAAGAEFGGRGRPTTQQFKPWRGSGEGAGYFLYPTIRRNDDRIADMYVDKINRLIERVGLS